MALNNVGDPLIALGQFAEASPMIQKAIRIHAKKNLGADNFPTLITRDLAGLIRRGERRYAEAEGIHRQVLEFERRARGPNMPTPNDDVSWRAF